MTAWTLLAEVKNLPGELVRFDQCRFGLVSKQDGIPTQKSTMLCTNMPAILRSFQNKTCLGDHDHSRIHGSEGGMTRSTWASFYPRDMCDALAKAVMEQWSKDHS